MDQRRLLRHIVTDTSSDVISPQKIYRSSLHCCLTTLRNEGVMGLYRGFVPAFMRMGPWNIIFFLVYEQLKKQNLASTSAAASDESWRRFKWRVYVFCQSQNGQRVINGVTINKPSRLCFRAFLQYQKINVKGQQKYQEDLQWGSKYQTPKYQKHICTITSAVFEWSFRLLSRSYSVLLMFKC